MLFWNKICGFIAIFFTISIVANAQTFAPKALYPYKEIKKISFSDTSFLTKQQEFQRIHHSFTIIPQNYYAQNLGIICKKELALEKVTKVPFRFRLGSLQQCNYLEGKR